MMTPAILLAAAYAFTATATGVEKGTPLEFFLIGSNSDRAYESMFVLDGSADDFCAQAERAGLPRGRPTNASACRLWPTGCLVKVDPPIGQFVDSALPDSFENVPAVYTGGSRTEKGTCRCDGEMPAAVYALYSLAQAPIVPDDIHEQGAVYGAHTARVTLKKGERVRFVLTWQESSAPRSLSVTARPGKGEDLIRSLKSESRFGNLDVLVDFDDALSLLEAQAVSRALAAIDSRRVRINGRKNFFYQAFLPAEDWRNRRQRLSQPLELTLDESGQPMLKAIREIWKSSDCEPTLTEDAIVCGDVEHYPKTDTCFIYADSSATVSSIFKAQEAMKAPLIRNWYVFSKQ